MGTMELKERVISWNDIDRLTASLHSMIINSGFKPEYILGLGRGGLIPAVILSHQMKIPLYPVGISVHNEDYVYENEIVCWAADDAYNRKNILIVDDIVRNGQTIAHFFNDLIASAHPHDNVWQNIYGDNVRVAAFFNNNRNIEFQAHYYIENFFELEENTIIRFPWETFDIKDYL